MHYEKFSDGTVKCIEDLIPFDIPDGWEWCKFRNIVELLSGQDLEPNRYNSEGVGIPYITGASNLLDGRVIINRWTDTPTTHATIDDLLLTCKGSGVGKMAICNIEDAHIARQIMALRCSSAICLSYLQVLMCAIITDITYQANGIIPGIRREIVLDTILPLPPYNEQIQIGDKCKKILSLTSEIDSDRAETMILIDKVKAKILDLAIRGQLVPHNPDDEPAAVLLERIRAEKEALIQQGKIKRDKRESVIFRGEDNSYYEKDGSNVQCIDDLLPFELPEGWVWARGFSCFSGMESRRPTGKKFDYIDIDAIDNHAHAITAPKHLPVSEAPSRASRAVQAGSVLFSLVRPYLQNIACVPDKYSHCIASTGFYVCNSCGILAPEYLYYLMLSPYVVDGLNQYMKGDNSPSISKDDIENWLYPIPPMTEQIAVCSKLKAIFSSLGRIERDLS